MTKENPQYFSLLFSMFCLTPFKNVVHQKIIQLLCLATDRHGFEILIMITLHHVYNEHYKSKYLSRIMRTMTDQVQRKL